METSAAAVQLVATFDCSPLADSFTQAAQNANLAEQVRVALPSEVSRHVLAPSIDSEDTIGTIVVVRLEDWLRPYVGSASGITNAGARQALRTQMDEFLTHLAVLGLRGRPVWLFDLSVAGMGRPRIQTCHPVPHDNKPVRHPYPEPGAGYRDQLAAAIR